MTLDLEQARREVYEAAYNSFQILDEDGHDVYETYAAVEEQYDQEIAPLIRSVFREAAETPHDERVDVTLPGMDGGTEIPADRFYNVMETHVSLAFTDAFDPGKERFESMIDGPGDMR